MAANVMCLMTTYLLSVWSSHYAVGKIHIADLRIVMELSKTRRTPDGEGQKSDLNPPCLRQMSLLY